MSDSDLRSAHSETRANVHPIQTASSDSAASPTQTDIRVYFKRRPSGLGQKCRSKSEPRLLAHRTSPLPKPGPEELDSSSSSSSSSSKDQLALDGLSSDDSSYQSFGTDANRPELDATAGAERAVEKLRNPYGGKIKGANGVYVERECHPSGRVRNEEWLQTTLTDTNGDPVFVYEHNMRSQIATPNRFVKFVLQTQHLSPLEHHALMSRIARFEDDVRGMLAVDFDPRRSRACSTGGRGFANTRFSRYARRIPGELTCLAAHFNRLHFEAIRSRAEALEEAMLECGTGQPEVKGAPIDASETLTDSLDLANFGAPQK